ncbi:MAG: hypothetical protein Q8K75_10905 [Chlamydiales bacterium]|nr:hypothetical protein [Chlamydiales bacterium]
MDNNQINNNLVNNNNIDYSPSDSPPITPPPQVSWLDLIVFSDLQSSSSSIPLANELSPEIYSGSFPNLYNPDTPDSAQFFEQWVNENEIQDVDPHMINNNNNNWDHHVDSHEIEIDSDVIEVEPDVVEIGIRSGKRKYQEFHPNNQNAKVSKILLEESPHSSLQTIEGRTSHSFSFIEWCKLTREEKNAYIELYAIYHRNRNGRALSSERDKLEKLGSTTVGILRNLFQRNFPPLDVCEIRHRANCRHCTDLDLGLYAYKKRHHPDIPALELVKIMIKSACSQNSYLFDDYADEDFDALVKVMESWTDYKIAEMENIVATLGLTVDATSLLMKPKAHIKYEYPVDELALVYAQFRCGSNVCKDVSAFLEDWSRHRGGIVRGTITYRLERIRCKIPAGNMIRMREIVERGDFFEGDLSVLTNEIDRTEKVSSYKAVQTFPQIAMADTPTITPFVSGSSFPYSAWKKMACKVKDIYYSHYTLFHMYRTEDKLTDQVLEKYFSSTCLEGLAGRLKNRIQAWKPDQLAILSALFGCNFPPLEAGSIEESFVGRILDRDLGLYTYQKQYPGVDPMVLARVIIQEGCAANGYSLSSYTNDDVVSLANSFGKWDQVNIRRMEQVIDSLKLAVDASSLWVKPKADIKYELPIEQLALTFMKAQCGSTVYSDMYSYYVKRVDVPRYNNSQSFRRAVQDIEKAIGIDGTLNQLQETISRGDFFAGDLRNLFIKKKK